MNDSIRLEPEVKVIKPEFIGGAEVYNSSEELHMAHRAAFTEAKKKEEEHRHLTDKEKLHALLDKYVAKHCSTKSVRKMAKENKNVEKYGADYQLDLSADIVEILEKIKNELR